MGVVVDMMRLAEMAPPAAAPVRVLLGREAWDRLRGAIIQEATTARGGRAWLGIPVEVSVSLPPAGAWVEYSDGHWERMV